MSAEAARAEEARQVAQQAAVMEAAMRQRQAHATMMAMILARQKVCMHAYTLLLRDEWLR